MPPSISRHEHVRAQAHPTHTHSTTSCTQLNAGYTRLYPAHAFFSTEATEKKKMNVLTHLSHSPKSTDESSDENLSWEMSGRY